MQNGPFEFDIFADVQRVSQKIKLLYIIPEAIDKVAPNAYDPRLFPYGG